MQASKIQRNMMIHVNGRTVRVRNRTTVGGRVRLDYDGGHITRKPGADIPTRAEITAGPVKAAPVPTLRTVRVSDGVWAGQRDGTTQERIISYSPGWDL